MSINPNALPDDPAVLKQLVATLIQQIEAMRRQVVALNRRQYGSTSERLAPGQARFAFAHEKPVPATAPEPELKTPETQAPAKRGRRPLPKDLPRKRIEYSPPPQDRACKHCGVELERIGEEISEQYEYVPASFFIVQHARLKYACPKCQEGVVVGPLPDKLIDKGLPGPGLLAQILVSKYEDHLPLYRQERIFGRHGAHIPRSSACQWIAWAAGQLEPLYRYMKQEILKSAKIHTDDTPVQVQEKGRGKTRTGRLWVYRGDEAHRYAVFEYTANRRRDGPAAFLKDYKGYLQADAYGGYDGLYAGNEIVEVACWAHARRKFFDARETDPRAYEALELIGRLYELERLGQPLLPHGRAQLRQLQARPVLERIHAWLHDSKDLCVPKSPLGQAIHYALGQWQALNRYLDDGILDVDNNKAENLIRPVALGRKNWLFCGNDAGGRRAAIAYSLIESCKLSAVDPWKYLYDVLPRLATHPASRIRELIPGHWKPRS